MYIFTPVNSIRPVLATNKSCTLQLATNQHPILFLIRLQGQSDPVIRWPLERRNGRGSDCTLPGETPRPSSFKISQESAPKPSQTSPCISLLKTYIFQNGLSFGAIHSLLCFNINTVIQYLFKLEPPVRLHQLPCFHQRHGAEVLQFSSCLCLSLGKQTPAIRGKHSC